MIKVELTKLDGVMRLEFTSNKPDDRDLLDTIGNLILCNNPKRGSYEGDVMMVDIKNGKV